MSDTLQTFDLDFDIVLSTDLEVSQNDTSDLEIFEDVSIESAVTLKSVLLNFK